MIEVETILNIRELEVGYDPSVPVVRGVSLEVASGAIVVLLGGSGTGKTTVLRAASGLLRSDGGVITGGEVSYLGQAINGRTPQQLARAGMVQLLQGRHGFEQLTVDENLITGAAQRGLARPELHIDLMRMYERLPRLGRKRQVAAGYLSIVEHQMLVIARAVMSGARVLLLDEPSLGLPYQAAAELYQSMRRLSRQDGVAFLVAEQNSELALRYADYGYVFEEGRIVRHGSPHELDDQQPEEPAQAAASSSTR